MAQPKLIDLVDRLAPREGMLLVVMAAAVGAGTGLAAVLFIRLIASIQSLCYLSAGQLVPAVKAWLYLLVPAAGALIVGPIITNFAIEAKGHGVPEVLQALLLRGGRIRPRVAIAKIIASALCIGTGGSAGREGPIVQVGSALGSSVGQLFHLSDERIKNLVACGAAAGIAATFNAPIAGVAFATEVLLGQMQVIMFGNVVLSAVSAAIVSRVFLGDRPAFQVPTYTMASPWEILLYGALGVLAALVGILFIRMLNAFEGAFDRWRCNDNLKPAVGAVLLGLVGLIYLQVPGRLFPGVDGLEPGSPLIGNMPHVYGSGFPFIEEVLQGRAPFWLLALLILVKPLATSCTLGSGNSGGVFAPSLFTGAMLGGFFGHLAGTFFPQIAGEVGAYALVGMAAVFSATARAPFTAMLIVFEMSNDYHLILPLMAAGLVASSLAQWLHPDSIYTMRLTRRGIRFDQGRDLDVMQGVVVEEVMNAHPVTVHMDQSVAETFVAFQETHLVGFPVMANDEDLYGIITLQDMERALARPDVNIRQLKVKDVATPSPVTVFPDEPVWSAIRKMAPRDLARLPVVSRHAPGKLLGLISRSDILRAYEVGLMHKQRTQHLRERMTLRKVAGVGFIDVWIPPGSPCGGKRLADIQLPAAATVVSVSRQGQVLIPHGSTVLEAGDLVTVFCQTEPCQLVRQILTQGPLPRAITP
ncbi:MAG: chloride channel protein [Thermodesulfobacteriota bacterium]